MTLPAGGLSRLRDGSGEDGLNTGPKGRVRGSEQTLALVALRAEQKGQRRLSWRATAGTTPAETPSPTLDSSDFYGVSDETSGAATLLEENVCYPTRQWERASGFAYAHDAAGSGLGALPPGAEQLAGSQLLR